MSSEVKKCEWIAEGLSDDWYEEPDERNYRTSCENLHTFIDGAIEENKYKFCPYCGNEIVEEIKP